jgi:hypothetical protein
MSRGKKARSFFRYCLYGAAHQAGPQILFQYFVGGIRLRVAI